MHSISSLAPSAEKTTRQDTCETHGAFEAVNYIGKIWSRCPACAQVLSDLRKKREEEEDRGAQSGAGPRANPGGDRPEDGNL